MLHRSHKAHIESATFKSVSAKAGPAFLVLLGLSLMALNRLNVGAIERLHTLVSDAVTPILSAVSEPVVTLSDNIEGVTSLRTLKAENIRLKEENAKLQQWYETALRMQAENKSLRDLLNVKTDPTLHYVSTRVAADTGGAFVKSMLLPIGATDGAKKGSAVMSGHGLIGRVTEVGNHSSRVLLVTDLNSRIPVIVQNTRTKAILAGKNGDLLKMERLPVDSGLSVGSRVVTSGDGGQLLPDIPIGTIVSVGKDGVWVQPLADINSLSFVEVINTDIDDSLLTGEVTPAPVKQKH